MVDVIEVGENIYMIDDQVCSVPRMGSVYLINEEKKALIDSGPPSSAPVVLAGLEQLGVRPEDIDYIVATHIHLDHGGGCGVLSKYMPGAKVVVHHKGASYLVEPGVLVESAVKALGAEVIAQHGEVVPVEPEKIQAVGDDDTITLGEQQVLHFIDAPGHAPHELCIHEKRNNGMFVGDAMGLYLGDGSVLLQCHPPPSFNPEVCISTIERLIKLDSATIYFAHFGACNRAQETYQMAIEQLQGYIDVLAKADGNDSLDAAIAEIEGVIKAELEPIKETPQLYEFVDKTIVTPCITGLVHYYKRRFNAKLTE